MSSIEVTTASEARANLKAFLDRATDDNVPVIISRPKGRSAVLMSLEEWNSWRETMHLVRVEANRRALDESIAEADRGELIAAELGPDGNWRPVDPAQR